MLSASEGHYVPNMQRELLGPALAHWGDRTVGDLTVAELTSWHESLRSPTSGKKIKGIELRRLNETGAGGVGYALGQIAGRAGGKRGPDTSVAQTLPDVGLSGLWVTATRVALVTERVLPHVAWTVDRAEIAGVRKSPRLQVLARFPVVFTDSSKATFMVQNKVAALILRKALGAH